MSGVLLCGVAVGVGNTPVVIGAITSITGFGAERQAVPNIHNDLTDGWQEVLISCIKAMKPFRVGLVHNTNSTQWQAWLEQALEALAITWPVESGYTTGSVYEGSAAVTDYTCGSADIQGRINAEMTITPSGKWEITAGTPD